MEQSMSSELVPILESCEKEITTPPRAQPACLKAIVTGVVGSGKSALINAIVGKEEAKEYDTILQVGTQEVKAYETRVGDIRVTLLDTPGLQSGLLDEQYISEIAKEYPEKDLIIHCIPSVVTRLIHSEKDQHFMAMKKLTTHFGQDFWRNSIIALTFANNLSAQNRAWDALEEEDRDLAFENKLIDFKDSIKNILSSDIGISDDIIEGIHFIPVGYHSNYTFHRDKNWLQPLKTRFISPNSLFSFERKAVEPSKGIKSQKYDSIPPYSKDEGIIGTKCCHVRKTLWGAIAGFGFGCFLGPIGALFGIIIGALLGWSGLLFRGKL